MLAYTTEDKLILDRLKSENPELTRGRHVLRLIPVGWTLNGDELFCLSRGDAREWEVVVVESRAITAVRYACELSTFLAAVLSKRLRCPAFPPTFPSSTPRFQSA
jgi:hypothetical protein